MTVRATDIIGNWSAQSTALNVTTPVQIPTNRVNNVGVNLTGYGGAGFDYQPDKIWADAMRTHRFWEIPWTGNRAALDANGWPTDDAQVIVYHGLVTKNNNGTYKLIFECNNPSGVTVTEQWGGGILQNKTTNGNTVTFDLVINDVNNEMMQLLFLNTSGGVRNVKLMRPVSPGSTTTYDSNTVFTNQILAAVAPFKTLRFFGWFNSGNILGDSTWSARSQWTYATQQPFNTYNNQNGCPSWETVIKFANATNSDAWICIPIRANDDYVTQLATLFRDGNANCAPLNSNLKIYVEYANEIWNTGYWDQWAWIQDKSKTYPELLFDNNADDITLVFRYQAMRTVQVSDIYVRYFVFLEFRLPGKIHQMLEYAHKVLTHRDNQIILTVPCT
jgi:hypothetical protein